MERKTIEENKNGARDYAVLVGLRSPVLGADSADEESLAELAALVETAGGESVGMILQSREKPDPHSFIGEGKVEEVKRMVENSEATMVIFDNDLSPSQVRVLTELCGVQVLDRSGLILDIFAQRARTKEGCLQVELAQYQYLLPRLIGMWSHLERQGGTGGSPIGTKGPGETQLETDRRHIRRKIDKLEGGAGGGAARPRHPTSAAAEERDTRGGHRGLYQRGQVHTAQRHHRRGHTG